MLQETTMLSNNYQANSNEIQAIEIGKVEKQNLLKNPYSSVTEYYGKHKVCYYKNGEPQITIGPHWYLSVLVVGIIFAIGYSLFGFLIQFKKGTMLYITFIVYCLDLVFFLFAALKNPGIVTKQNQQLYQQEDLSNYEICEVCQVRKGPKVHHCSDCEVCILDQDHHCPWTSKCIGRGNIIYFNLFILCTFAFFFCCTALTLK